MFTSRPPFTALRSRLRKLYGAITPTGRRRVRALRQVARVSSWACGQMLHCYDPAVIAVDQVRSEIETLHALCPDVPQSVAASIEGALFSYRAHHEPRAIRGYIADIHTMARHAIRAGG